MKKPVPRNARIDFYGIPYRPSLKCVVAAYQNMATALLDHQVQLQLHMSDVTFRSFAAEIRANHCFIHAELTLEHPYLLGVVVRIDDTLHNGMWRMSVDLEQTNNRPNTRVQK